MNLKKMKHIRKIAAVCCVLLLLWGNAIVSEAEDTEISESMVLDEGIAWNVFTDSNVESVDFEINGKSETVTSWNESNDKRCFEFRGTGPKMLTDELTVTAHLSGNKTRVHRTSAVKYLLGLQGKSDKLDALIDALLAYGTAVQIYENYHTERLANGMNISGAKEVLGKIEFSGTSIKNIDYGYIDPSVKWTGASVILGDKVSVVLGAKIVSEGDSFDGKYLNTYINGTYIGVNHRTDTSSTESNFTFGIPVTQYSSEIKANFTDFYGNAISPSLTYSVESYVTRMYGKTTDTNLKNLLSAFADYCSKAKLYAESV